MPCGSGREEDDRKHRRRHSDESHRRIEGYGLHEREFRRAPVLQQYGYAGSQCNTYASARKAQQRSLGQELSDQARRVGTDSCMGCYFASTVAHKAQGESRKVETADQQHESDRTESKKQRLPAVSNY
ncbi:MAG: hypothetical protein OXN89_15810 [Bryobacterales bacterium]|nr:hypothetical protein [Bryobacterales bacterium]